MSTQIISLGLWKIDRETWVWEFGVWLLPKSRSANLQWLKKENQNKKYCVRSVFTSCMVQNNKIREKMSMNEACIWPLRKLIEIINKGNFWSIIDKNQNNRFLVPTIFKEKSKIIWNYSPEMQKFLMCNFWPLSLKMKLRFFIFQLRKLEL